MRTRFDKELDHLHEAMEEIGQLCKESISESVSYTHLTLPTTR